MKRKLVMTLSAVFMAIILVVAPVLADDIPGWLESFWMPDPLQPGVEWWRDTSNQNALAQYYNDTYPQTPFVETVLPGVYVVKGVGKSNVVALVGDTEWVLIDSMESPTYMQLALLLLRPYTGAKQLKNLIYTSEDYAHYNGSAVVSPLFSIPVYANSEFFNSLAKKASVAGNFMPRTLKINGIMLPQDPDWRIGPATVYGKFPFHYPNRLIAGETTLTLAGFNITLIPAVSATDAGLLVWLPDQKVLVSGDAWSPSFPDIGPLSGHGLSVKTWQAALNSMLALNPDYMVPTHGPVISPNIIIQSVLANYRDAMTYVHDRTVALINTGLTGEDAASLVQLPEPLASDPFLQQFIADIPSAVKSISQQYVGWFNGEPPELASSLTPARQAEIMVELAGGIEQMLDTAKNAEIAAQDLQSAEKALWLAWAAYKVAPDNITAIKVYAQALKKNAYMQRSNQIRNYYLSTAQEIETYLPADLTPPVVVITSPEDGATYNFGAVPEPAYTVTDDIDPNPAVVVEGWSNEVGEHTMTVTAADSTSNVGSASVTYMVIANNTSPIAQDDSATTDEGTPVTINVLVNDSDPDDDILVVDSVTQGINGSVAINADGTVTYTPNASFFGSDLFTYTISDGKGGNATAIVMVTVNPVVIQVSLDIKPGSNQNSINLGSKGVTPVAVLTTVDFNASMINPETVLFAGVTPSKWTLEDIDGDGDLDLLFHFDTEKLNLTESSTQATLTGQTADGHEITGTDSVKIVPAKDKK